MIQKIVISLYVLCFILFISACENKVEINAAYKEVPIIYALIDAGEDQHYVRIERAFQNSDDVTSAQITQIPDSLYFDTLVVKMYDKNNPSNFVFLDRYDGFKKDSGVFTTQRNTIYTCKLLPITSGNLVLEVTNPKSGKTYTASTTLITEGEFKDNFAPFVSMNESDARVIQYVFSQDYIKTNAYMYDLFVRLYYREMNVLDTSIYTDKTIDYYFEKAKLSASFLNYSNAAYKKTTWKAYLNFLSIALAKDNTKTRRVLTLTYSAYGGTKDFSELQELTKPVLGFVQRNPEYSNINNGALGIFTSRRYMYKEKALVDSSLYFIAKYAPNFTY